MIEPALQLLGGKIAAVDFDGVLHHYTGWNGETPKGNRCLGVC